MEVTFDHWELDIKIDPPRKDGAAEGIRGIKQEPGVDPQIVRDDLFTNPKTSQLSIDDAVDDDSQLSEKDSK